MKITKRQLRKLIKEWINVGTESGVTYGKGHRAETVEPALQDLGLSPMPHSSDQEVRRQAAELYGSSTGDDPGAAILDVEERWRTGDWPEGDEREDYKSAGPLSYQSHRDEGNLRLEGLWSAADQISRDYLRPLARKMQWGEISDDEEARYHKEYDRHYRVYYRIMTMISDQVSADHEERRGAEREWIKDQDPIQF